MIYVQFDWARTPNMLSVVQITKLALVNNVDVPALMAFINMAWCVGFTTSVIFALFFAAQCFREQLGKSRER